MRQNDSLPERAKAAFSYPFRICKLIQILDHLQLEGVNTVLRKEPGKVNSSRDDTKQEPSLQQIVFFLINCIMLKISYLILEASKTRRELVPIFKMLG